MTAAVHISWLSGVVRLLPATLRNALDAWSYRIAMEHAERRRNAGKVQVAAAAPAPIDYKVRPWRD